MLPPFVAFASGEAGGPGYSSLVPTVLVVDDDPVILKLLEVNFEMEGFVVLTAKDGVEGVERTRTDRPAWGAEVELGAGPGRSRVAPLPS